MQQDKKRERQRKLDKEQERGKTTGFRRFCAKQRSNTYIYIRTYQGACFVADSVVVVGVSPMNRDSNPFESHGCDKAILGKSRK